jgi:DNA-binding transcriptional LysR family regulator
MDIQQLRYFISLAKHLNFTKAAQEQFITQPALSQ